MAERIKVGGEADTTNNRMELLAAIRAFEAIAADNPLPVFVRSDSQYLVKGWNEYLPGWIAKGWKKSDKKPVLNQDLWQRLVAALAGRSTTFEWVRGHAGDPGNEEVDGRAEAEAKRQGRKSAVAA